MTDKDLTDKLNRFLDLLLDGLQKGADFAAEQAPLVVQELIAWKRAEHTLLAAGFLLAILLYACVVKWKLWPAVKEASRESLDREFCRGAFWVFGYILPSAGLVAGFIMQTHYALQVWLAPRLYLIEYIAGLIKGK